LRGRWRHLPAGGVKYRIADIDTPETRPPRCAAEAAPGARATRRLAALLNAGPFSLEKGKRESDSYGRTLRVVTRGGASIGARLVAEGLARPWRGHRDPWCWEKGRRERAPRRAVEGLYPQGRICPMARPTPDPLPPIDEENSEQADSGTQANDVADDARLRGTDRSEDSEHGGTPDRTQIMPDDTPDLVDRMNAMNRSGRIDNDAYDGEPMMDDEEDGLGETDSDEDEL
jgi:hypothetical protein